MANCPQWYRVSCSPCHHRLLSPGMGLSRELGRCNMRYCVSRTHTTLISILWQGQVENHLTWSWQSNAENLLRKYPRDSSTRQLRELHQEDSRVIVPRTAALTFERFAPGGHVYSDAGPACGNYAIRAMSFSLSLSTTSESWRVEYQWSQMKWENACNGAHAQENLQQIMRRMVSWRGKN